MKLKETLSDPSFREALNKKLFAAEKNAAIVRFLVILLNSLVYIFLIKATGNRTGLAFSIIIVAILYSLWILGYQPYRKYKILTTSLFTSFTDGILICLWIYSTGSFYSEFYVLWYISLIAIALRFSFSTTLKVGAAYVLAYLLVIFIDNGLEVPLHELVIRCGYIMLVAGLAGLSSKEMTEQIQSSILLEKSQKEIIRSENQLKDAQQIAHVGSWEWDVLSNKVSWSDELFRIFGYEPEEVTISFEKYLSHVHPDDRDNVRKNISAATDMGSKYDDYYRIYDKTGIEKILRSQGRPETDQNGRIIKLIGTCYDVTEQKVAEQKLLDAHLKLEERVKERTSELKTSNELLKIEVKNRKEAERNQADLIQKLDEKNQQLKQNNEDIDHFVYSVTHDLKSPILNMEALINILFQESENFNSDLANDVKNKLDNSFQKLQATIEKLAVIAKSQQSVFDDLEEINIREIYAEVVAENDQIIKSANTIIKTSFADTPGFICSKTCLKSILYNFIINAVKYRNPQSDLRIKITYKCQDNEILLEVADNGIGIDLEKYGTKLFSLFSRFHNHIEGTGIGLYMVKRMVEKFNGRIDVISAPGSGTTFKVVFPLENGLYLKTGSDEPRHERGAQHDRKT